MYRSTGLSPELQAAADAKVSRLALRGLVEIIGMVRSALDAQQLPAHPQDVIGALCENPLGWVVVSLPKLPYAYLRAPVTSDGVVVRTVDLRRIQPESERPAGIHQAAWPRLYAAAKDYHATHPGVRA